MGDDFAIRGMPSNQISWMMDSEADGASWNQRSDSYEPDHMSMFFDHVGWNKLLEDVGVKGRWISYLELANGTLAIRGVKVLILPRALALSQVERDVIEKWVAVGGTLIADSLTGIYDEQLQRRSIARGGGWWDEFLGVKREDYSFVEMNGQAGSAYGNATAAPTPAGNTPPQFAKLLDGITPAGLRGVEAGLRAGSGTPLLHFGKDASQPALLVKTHGSGHVVYLNLGLTKYGFSPPDGGGSEAKKRPRKDQTKCAHSHSVGFFAAVRGRAAAPEQHKCDQPSEAHCKSFGTGWRCSTGQDYARSQ